MCLLKVHAIIWGTITNNHNSTENECNHLICNALIKKKIKFSSYIRKFRVEQLQSHIWLTASSYMGKYLRISSYIRKPFRIYDFATAPFWISLYMRKILFSFYQCASYQLVVFMQSFLQAMQAASFCWDLCNYLTDRTSFVESSLSSCNRIWLAKNKKIIRLHCFVIAIFKPKPLLS
jgi:hypothetical protein